MADLDLFDVEELLHLAVDASAKQRNLESLAMLKRITALEPNHAKAVYFTAVVYAQIGLFERALEMMKRAVDLEPGLDIARFQLGLLYFTSGRVPEAVRAWEPLDSLGPQHPLFLFKTGLSALGRDDFAACRSYLQRGIDANEQNPPLNADMQKILDRIPNDADQKGAASTRVWPVSTSPREGSLGAGS